ncbi:FAD-dependent oxidoreductase [Gemmatimonas sp.]|uniref:FAD-dependent oxidoreductase n=1 Tax=Gemmatimonas sp. TaxID=1962908 RepID=UPI00286A6CE7|nr:FAD-dependent oxidoreductase [Gemmatimonas sp.]
MSRAVVVVGGGITGCITALRLARAGHAVTLIESTSTLGGTLRDFPVGDTAYLRGCQYVEATAPWLAPIATLVARHLITVPHAMGSYTVQDGVVRTATGVAVPLLGGALPAAATGDTALDDVTLENRVARYGPWSTTLRALAERSGHPTATLAADAAIALQMIRVLPADVPVDAVIAAKREWAWADARIAARRESRGDADPVAMVPRAGWSPFFGDLHADLASVGVTVRTGRAAKVSLHGAHLRAVLDGQRLDGTLVWAANPVPLAPLFGLGTLDNAFVPSTNIHARVTSWQGVAPLYVQWHDADSPLLRVYLYEWAGELRACLECYGSLSAADALRVAQHAMREMAPWGDGLTLADPIVDKHRRHHLLTAADVTRLHALERMLGETDAVGGAWAEYGREQKLAAIAGRLAQLGLLDPDRLD